MSKALGFEPQWFHITLPFYPVGTAWYWDKHLSWCQVILGLNLSSSFAFCVTIQETSPPDSRIFSCETAIMPIWVLKKQKVSLLVPETQRVLSKCALCPFLAHSPHESSCTPFLSWPPRVSLMGRGRMRLSRASFPSPDPKQRGGVSHYSLLNCFQNLSLHLSRSICFQRAWWSSSSVIFKLFHEVK